MINPSIESIIALHPTLIILSMEGNLREDFDRLQTHHIPIVVSNPRTLEVCALLTKPERRKVDLPTRYIGFEIPDKFVVGYGLDYAERYRNLRCIGTLAESVHG